ncbi:flagellar export chaperone FliS [Paenibacillus sp. 598K]|uniref:flagellar export chaperone FliS n=1 Tax=Paenibacillus sp. 598K TaxID=1117987 RepID=UPI000FF9DED4|nr:flagellar export chaperone FliS [Paenibacillus sp. 598K]GBF76276.1 flagellar export chaperone FliS [Paenibacillus sp. 598K]
MQLQQRNKYLETTVQTASPAQLLIMLYDGAIRASRAAIAAIEAGQIAETNTQLQKVQAIIDEFVITLDQSSPLAPGLLQLYDYFKTRLTEANVTKTAAPAEEVVAYLVEMKETWIQAAKVVNQAQGAPAGGQYGSYHPSTHTTVI